MWSYFERLGVSPDLALPSLAAFPSCCRHILCSWHQSHHCRMVTNATQRTWNAAEMSWQQLFTGRPSGIDCGMMALAIIKRDDKVLYDVFGMVCSPKSYKNVTFKTSKPERWQKVRRQVYIQFTGRRQCGQSTFSSELMLSANPNTDKTLIPKLYVAMWL